MAFFHTYINSLEIIFHVWRASRKSFPSAGEKLDVKSFSLSFIHHIRFINSDG